MQNKHRNLFSDFFGPTYGVGPKDQNFPFFFKAPLSHHVIPRIGRNDKNITSITKRERDGRLTQPILP